MEHASDDVMRDYGGHGGGLLASKLGWMNVLPRMYSE